MQSKFDTLITILDQIRKEAPREYKSYYPLDTDEEGVNSARAKAYIHLFLKVSFGLVDFLTREEFITDGTQDGGIDAYYLDKDARKIFLIQSKFRSKFENFNNKEIQLSELLKMDIKRITEGHDTDEKGISYNKKILRMKQSISEIPDIGRWNYVVVMLGNLSKSITQEQLKRLTGHEVTIFNYEKTYNELVFPVIQGTYYHQDELKLSINLSNSSSPATRISYKVTTETQTCDITVLFVPTSEIAHAMYKYRNSILRYNPRSYLELKNNDVNRAIEQTIRQLTTNEFALYNNGITMLSFGTAFNEHIGELGKAQLIITGPQIINGGQTAFTLSRIYEEQLAKNAGDEIFRNKEVLLKVITFHPNTPSQEGSYLGLIEAISRATNQQSQVDEADRRSNEEVQIQLQRAIFESYGYFYERKRGEFADGIRANYISKSQIIDRDVFLRLCISCAQEPAIARYMGRKRLFETSSFRRHLNDSSQYHKYFFAYKCFEKLGETARPFSRDRNNKLGIVNYGNALIYGRYAVVSACSIYYENERSIEMVSEIVTKVLSKWLEFENYVTTLSSNSTYFRTYKDLETEVQKQEQRFDNYYKGSTLSTDIVAFFQPSSL